ncbi:MAG TPA: alpha/beta hydrolase [Nevskiaceae bacterium]
MNDSSPAAGQESRSLQPQYIEANGIEFAYLEVRPQPARGSAPLVLCLHGFPDTAWSFVPLLERLAAAGYRGVSLFMRGYQPTAFAPDGRYSIEDLGRDVIALFEHFGAGRAHIVGHDWGALAAYAAAALRPDRVASIITAGMPHPRPLLLRPSRAQWHAMRRYVALQLPGTLARRMTRDDYGWLRDLVREWSPGWDSPQAYWTRIAEAFEDIRRRRAALAYYRQLPRSVFRRGTWRLLMRPVQVPARAICGERDGCMLVSSFERQAHLFGRGYRLVRLPDVGHFMHLEASDKFADEVIAALGDAGRG